jgi:hypothetical protein
MRASQQNKESPLILTELTEHKKTMTYCMMLEFQALAWDRHEKVAGLNQIMITGSQTAAHL